MKHSELFQEIERITKPVQEGGIDGWTSTERGCEYASIILALRPMATVELGTWCGRGACCMALAHRFIGSGAVHVVDPWSGGASAVGMDGENAQWWSDQEKHEYAFKTFNAHRYNLGLSPWIKVQRKTSDEAEIPEVVGLLVVDGNHGPQAIKDVERWTPNVSRSGYVYLDDLNWEHGNVAAAGDRLLSMGFTPAWSRDQGMFYVRSR